LDNRWQRNTRESREGDKNMKETGKGEINEYAA
jgi:hypothetical protein